MPKQRTQRWKSTLGSTLGGMLLMMTVSVTNAWALEALPAPPLTATEHVVPDPRLAGEGRLRYFGFLIYDARLWVGPEFTAQAFDRHPFILELTYHRAFSGESIAKRSVEEIKRQITLTPEQEKDWEQELIKWLPNVESGERLTGLYLPGEGMRLWHGEQLLGTLPNPDLARYFFGIWLSEQTSEPDLRSDLLAKLNKGVP